MLSDTDSTTLTQATVLISDNFIPNEDSLEFSDSSDITGNYDSTTGVLTLTDSSTITNYQTLLRSIKYRNTSNNPNTALRNIDFSVNDGSSESNLYSRELVIEPIDNQPVLVNNQLIIEENANVILNSLDLSATDADTSDTELIFSVTNVVGGHFELITSGSSVTTFSQQQISDSQISFIQDGSESVAYDVSVSDGTSTTEPVSATITFININDTPVIASSSVGFTTFIESGNDVIIDSGITVSDMDSTTLIQATVLISDNFMPNEDSLEFSDSSDITGSYDPTTSVLTLTGSSSIANYQTFLRGIKYRNTSNNPNTASRTIEFSVNDGTDESNLFSRELVIEPLSNQPVLINNQLIIEENENVVLSPADLSADDPDSADTDIVFTVTNVEGGQFELNFASDPVTSFTQQQINTGQVRFSQDGSESVFYEVSVSDGTSATAPVAANVFFINVNDAPIVISNIPDKTLELEVPFNFIVLPDEIFSDPDGDPLSYQVEQDNGKALPNWLSYSMENNQSLLFAGIPPSTGQTRLSLLATDPQNAQGKTDFALTVPSGGSGGQNNIAGIAGGAAAGGVIALGVCAFAATAGIFGAWRYRKHQQFKEIRATYPFANALREKLNLTGVDNFESENSTAYRNAVEVLNGELKRVGIDISSFYNSELDGLVTPLANVIKANVPNQPSKFRGIKIDPSDLQNNATVIANAMRGVDLTARNPAPGSEGDIEMNPIHLPKSSVGRLDSPR